MVSKPHGDKLVRKIAARKTRERILSEKDEFPKLTVSTAVAIDAENIAHGIYSPLTGFMRSYELSSVLEHMRLPNDLPWTIPIVLDAPEDSVNFDEGDAVLLFHGGEVIARMYVDEIYRFDKKEFSEKVFRTSSEEHPGVRKVINMGEYLVGGEIELLNEVENPFAAYTLRPVETRVLFKERGWNTIVAFQTRNVPHMGHEYVQKAALTFVDGLFINPVIGKKKKGDYKDDVILRCYEVLFRNYYPTNASVLATVRYEMKYAGPREAVHHAIMRKNFGCTHFIVGRDHAGVGNFYKPYEAQEIFEEFPDLGIVPMFFREFFFCKKCGSIVNEKVCPHPKEYREYFSGTKIREMITRGEKVPPHFMREEVYDALKSFDDPFVGEDE